MTKQYENEVSSAAFEWLRCSSQSIVVYHFYSQLVLPPYTVKVRGGRHSTTHEEGSSRWALVLPPNTIKIRGGRSIFLRHSQARVLPSHAVKTGRGRSTRHYHQHWSSISPVWGKWHHWTTLRHLSRWNICIPGPHHSNAAKPTSFPYCSMIAASSTKSRANSIQSMHTT